MRAYSETSEEALRTRDLLKDWAGESLLAQAQYQQMEKETVCDLRRTNIFLRIVLFLFTLIIVGASMVLFFVIFRPRDKTNGVFLLIFAGIAYAAAELAVSRARLHRFGIEEALSACSVGFLCVGMEFAFFNGYPSAAKEMEFVVPAAGAIASLWVWRRFGLPYAFLAAMICAIWIPVHWTESHAAQRVIVAAFYAGALLIVAALRPRHRFSYLNGEYSIAEALLWLGIYVAINLQLFSVITVRRLAGEPWATTTEFSKPLYWATFVLIWCLPPVVLLRGLRLKDRFVIAVGAIVAILTLATNKPYLGWQRQTWDPMLLGVLLIALALFLRRWLARGPGGVRRGFTAQRLSGKDKRWMSAAITGFGAAASSAVTSTPQPEAPGFHFGGGDSGGGGASSDF